MNLPIALTLLTLSGAAPKFKPYDSKSDAFHVEFPGAPKTETSKDDGLVSNSYTVESEFGIYQVLSLSDPGIEVDEAKTLLDSFREAMKSDAKITLDKPVTLGALKGLELKTQGKDVDTWGRMFVTKGRTYTVTVVAVHGHSFAELGGEQFLSSFSVGGAASASAPPPPPKAQTAAPTRGLEKDGVELFGWTPDGTKVAYIEHGVYDGKGTPWAKVTFLDTTKNAQLGKPLEVELDVDATEDAAVAEAKKRASAEWTRLKLPAAVPGKKIATDEKGELTGSDGGPVGTLTVVTRKGKKGGDCPDGFGAELLSVKLDLMGGDGTIKVLDEKKTPANRTCSGGCKPSSTYGQGKGALFVLTCSVQGFEGSATKPMIVPLGKLEYALEGDLPPQ